MSVLVKALRSLEVSPDGVRVVNVRAGEEVELPEWIADSLEKQGSAKKLAAPANKRAPAPENKAEGEESDESEESEEAEDKPKPKKKKKA